MELSYSALSLCLLAYLGLVSSLRYRRVRRATSRIEARNGGSYKRMTVDQAHSVFLYLAELEFPMLWLNANAFALFKTYGVSSISRLLAETGQFKNDTTTSKRTADTAAILLEVWGNSPTSDRSAVAIARMNYLHTPYRKSEKISDDDMLYTLCLFAVEPARWVQEFEWRELTEMELCALGTFWKSMGDAMDIPMDQMLSEKDSSPSKNGDAFTDGLDWFYKARAWSRDYEARHSKSAPTNRPLADAEFNYFLWFLPKFLRPAGLAVYLCLFQPELRRAFDYSDPPVIVEQTVQAVLWLRKIIIRHLCLPRPAFLGAAPFAQLDKSSGRLYAPRYMLHPWYVPPTWWNRWGPEGWFVWARGGSIPGDNGDHFRPDGFKITEIGPMRLPDKAAERVKESSKEIREMRGAGCPFAMKSYTTLVPGTC